MSGARRRHRDGGARRPSRGGLASGARPPRDRRPDILRIPKRRKIKPGRGNRPGGWPWAGHCACWSP